MVWSTSGSNSSSNSSNSSSSKWGQGTKKTGSSNSSSSGSSSSSLSTKIQWKTKPIKITSSSQINTFWIIMNSMKSFTTLVFGALELPWKIEIAGQSDLKTAMARFPTSDVIWITNLNFFNVYIHLNCILMQSEHGTEKGTFSQHFVVMSIVNTFCQFEFTILVRLRKAIANRFHPGLK